MSRLTALAEQVIHNTSLKTLDACRRIRAIHNQTIIIDTTKALYVWEHDNFPTLYVPRDSLQNCELKVGQDILSERGNVAAAAEIVVPPKSANHKATIDNVLVFASDDRLGVLSNMVRVQFGDIDQWLEEDAPIYVHPKDPFKRVDILPSQRKIEVQVMGKTVAIATSSMHLFETGLPTRYYLPLSSVDQSVLEKSKLRTRCPYKGEAEYYHVVVDGQEMGNLVWYYTHPTHESAAIAGLVCFYNEKVDIVLDGVLQTRPKTKFA